jgi:hypothetical protein
MAVEYRRVFPRTRRHLAWQNASLLVFLLPLWAWRLPQERLVVSLALALLIAGPLILAYRGLRFLQTLEARQATPTPEMTFVFELVATVPLAMSGFMLILLSAL